MEKPLAEILRPKSLDEMVGQPHLLNADSIFRKSIANKHIPNMIFYGPPGTGKTTAANIIANQSGMTLYRLNGTIASTQDIKQIIAEIDSLFSQNGILLYLDEIQYLNKKQQQSLLDYVEKGDITLIASTTENPYFYVYPALISRCVVFEFKQVIIDDISKNLKRCAEIMGVKIEEDALLALAAASNGDVRKSINYFEVLINALYNKDSIDKTMVDSLIDKSNIVYDRSEDKHFDHLSALMKSLRGSDPDAAVFYLTKMLEAGDLIAVCRRILCSCYEDVGLAYPNLGPIVKSCVDSALQLGLPEGRLPLLNAVILIATAPKSNSAYLAGAKASEDIKKGLGTTVPRTLQNTHFDGEDALIKGQNYLYPHDFKDHYVEQQYLPDDIKDHRYYEYGDNKFEQSLKTYWDKIKK